MRRLIGLMTMTLAVGVLQSPRPASAAGFLAINGGTWSYSAAAASSPAGTAYFWGLSIGVGSYSYAYAYSYSGINSAAAYAVARAGYGWRGAWYARGFADPQADIGLGIPDIGPTSLSTLVNNLDSTDLGTEVNADASSSSPGYVINTDGSGNIDGITFNSNASDSETNGLDQLSLIVVNSNALTDFCNAIGDSGCSAETGQTNQSGDVTDLSNLIGDLGSSVLATETEIDPANLSNGDTWSFPSISGSSGDQVLLVEEGTIPEPASMLLFVPGLLTLGLIARRRRRS